MNKIHFKIEENPVAQKRHRHSRFVVYDPISNDKTRIKNLIIKQCKDFYTDGPVSMIIDFNIQRPKSHFGTGKNSKIVKAKAPTLHIQKPDIDNYIKLYCDVLTNCGIWKDDSQIINISASKHWVDNNPCTKITVFKL